MTFCAHTAEDENGRRLPETQWQLLKDHLSNVAVLAKRLAMPVRLEREAELAEKPRSQKHLTATEYRETQRYSVNLYQTEFFDAQAKGYLYQSAKDWDFWVWNPDYDNDLGLGHEHTDLAGYELAMGVLLGALCSSGQNVSP
jgi:hypothetical protein